VLQRVDALEQEPTRAPRSLTRNGQREERYRPKSHVPRLAVALVTEDPRAAAGAGDLQIEAVAGGITPGLAQLVHLQRGQFPSAHVSPSNPNAYSHAYRYLQERAGTRRNAREYFLPETPGIARLFGRPWNVAERLLAEREGFEPPIRLPVCRISSAVLSTTQPPLRGRKRRKHPVGRGLCIQRETAKQGRSVAPCKRLIVARDRAGGRRT
jgi:hypothetical protein